jgi:Holliday junction resolvasome RuvABC endonuclease subunit
VSIGCGPSVLALDLSLTRTGWCDAFGVTGVIDTAKLRGVERMDHIIRQVQSLASGADLVVREGYSFGSQGRSVFDIGELGGAVRLLLYRLGIPLVEIPPSSLKKFATGKGNSNKDAMISAAIRRFGFGGSDNNEADAYILWCMAMHALDARPLRLPAAHLAALDKVVWPTAHPTGAEPPE